MDESKTDGGANAPPEATNDPLTAREKKLAYEQAHAKKVAYEQAHASLKSKLTHFFRESGHVVEHSVDAAASAAATIALTGRFGA